MSAYYYQDDAEKDAIRIQIEECIIEKAKFWWPNILFSGEVADSVAAELLERFDIRMRDK